MHNVPFDIAFRKGSAAMRTRVRNGVAAALNAKKRDCGVANCDRKTRVVAQV